MERNRLLFFAIFQTLPFLILPPSILFSLTGIYLIITMLVIFGLLAWGLMKAKEWALTLSIFMQGMNVIVRLMMLFPNAVNKQGVWDLPLLVTFLAAIGLSAWLMLRLDRPDIRSLISA